MAFNGSASFPRYRRSTSHLAALQESKDSIDSVDKNYLVPGREHGDSLYIGDIYEEKPTKAETEWRKEQPSPTGPYLEHIMSIQDEFPHLQYLANWMQVSTAPAKWDLLKDHSKLRAIRKERAQRIQVATVDFYPRVDKTSPAEKPMTTRITSLPALESSLDEQISLPKTSHRLYIVEDLSREVIELLGLKLDLDPLFFREQISDYTWANVRDPWVELPDLDIVSRERPYFHMTYIQSRYFKTKEDFDEAKREAGFFNVLRRLDDDTMQKSVFDESTEIVAHVRSKFSLWTRPANDDQAAAAVLLLDPTVKAGFPLWKGYRPFANSPVPSAKIAQRDSPAPTLQSLMDNVIHWTERMSPTAIDEIPRDPRIMAYRMFQIYCAEWLSASCYIQARLGQIEWEIESEKFRAHDQIGPSLAKLHTWRRRVPLYKNNVTTAEELLFRDDRNEPPYNDQPGRCILDLKKDFKIVSNGISEVLLRTERIAAVATAVTAIEETQRAVQHNVQLGRLTYLAVIFAPLSFVTSFFSMSADLESLTTTFWAFFCVAIPMSIAVYLLVEKEWKKNLPMWWLAPLHDKFDKKKWQKSGAEAVILARKAKKAKADSKKIQEAKKKADKRKVEQKEKDQGSPV